MKTKKAKEQRFDTTRTITKEGRTTKQTQDEKPRNHNTKSYTTRL